jgi:hypothetical protein
MERWRELPTSIAPGVRWIVMNAYREASLTVYEPDNPPWIEWFL